ncbi:ATP-binding protein [Paenibacillus sp.]|uniref:ATP-binding protein n=1 Tax=Paenibacillus sp. TaxID=58172 RepID=UPI002D6BC23C|nr:ATP-binding protein [Paenibacillus sp.]HZG56745.1 ATP-binding protein [Paenibacillus sp.]
MNERDHLRREPDASFEENVDILMVDDRPENLLALEACLASPAYRLIAKPSGEDALRYALQADLRRLALILMDVHMPGMDGYETAMLMRERKELRHVPIIFITATYKSKSNVKQGYLSGSIDYVFKPFDPDILRWKVENFVSLYRYQRELNHKNALLQERNREIELVNRRLTDAERRLLQHQKVLEQVVEERTKQLREANQEIYRSNRRFRTVFYTNPNLIAIRRLHDGTYLDVNDAWEKVTGCDVERMNALGEAALGIRESDRREADPHDGSKQIEYTTRSGERRHGLLSAQVLEVNDEPCELIVITDISERVALQKHLNRLDRLNLIGEMAAGIAHEIRNPMTTIQGFLQIWRKSEAPLPAEHIDLMLSELLRANQIITEYLSLAGNKESQFGLHRTQALIESVSPLLQAVAVMAEKSIEVRCESEGVYVRADENEMRQVILNLAKNGLEAMDAGGCLTIRTHADSEAAIIDVIDEGPGIPDHVLEKLGTPFFTTKEQGTGLGLALCYSIVERHQGTLAVTSGPRGTMFSLRLPRVAEDEVTEGTREVEA